MKNRQKRGAHITRQQADRARVVRAELTKVRCWMTGFQAGTKGAAIPGEDGLRQAILFLDELLEGEKP